MGEPIMFNVEMLLGHVAIKNVYAIDGGTLHLGGYSIHYDQHGKETHRTEPTFNCSMSGPWQEHLPLLIGYERLDSLPPALASQDGKKE